MADGTEFVHKGNPEDGLGRRPAGGDHIRGRQTVQGGRQSVPSPAPQPDLTGGPIKPQVPVAPPSSAPDSGSGAAPGSGSER